MFDVQALVGLGRVNALVPEPGGSASVAVVERLDADGAKYVSDLWLVPHDGSAARRLTQGDTRDRAPAWLADGTLLFVSDRVVGKDEARAQVWALPQRGEAFVVTDEPHGVSDFKVAGTTLVVLCELLPGVALDAQRKTLADKKKLGPSILKYTAQPVRFWDHWLGPTEPRLVAYDLEGAKVGTNRVGEALCINRRELTADAGDALRESSWDLSPDGRHVAITWAVMSPLDRIHDKPVALIATSSGARTLLGREEGAVHAAPRFTKDGQRLVAQRYVRSREGYAQRRLWSYELPDGAARELPVGDGGWDRWPGPWAVMPDGSVLATAEEAGKNLLHLIDDHGVRVVGPTTGSWDHVAWVPGTNTVVGVRSALLAPPEPFHLDLSTNVLTPLAALSGFAAQDSGIRAHEIRIEVGAVGDRQRAMSAYIVEPAAPNGRTAVWIHGGPVYAWMDHWHWRWSALALAAKGYRVVLPNPSGSTGFGIDWVNDIWGNCWGERCHDDLMRLVAHLEATGTATRDIAIMGASFGGYMTNWIGGHDTRFRALVTHASVYDMSAFHGVTDFPAWWELMMQGAPWSSDYDRYSPSRFVQHWKTPTLVLHGERDYRVPIGEGLALFEALQAHGVWSELVIFPDEHHWVLKPRNAIAWYETTLDFLDRVWAAT